MPTPKELRAEIETGPLARELAPFWADVFPLEPEPENVAKPEEAENRGNEQKWAAWRLHEKWQRGLGRVGLLKPDATYAIEAILRNPAAGRTKAFPMKLSSLLQFLTKRRILKRLIDGQNHAEAGAASVCCNLVLQMQSGADREVDPDDAAVQEMIAELLQTGLVGEEDLAAFSAACTRPCSRLDELDWSVNLAQIEEAKRA